MLEETINEDITIGTALGRGSETKGRECEVKRKILQQLSDVFESTIMPEFVRYGVWRDCGGETHS